MEPAMEVMEAQLKRWSVRIDDLAAKTQVAGMHPGFNALIYVDELKVLHAIALAKFNQFKAEEDSRRARLEAEMKCAWDELAAAFDRQMP